jgi:hypothetical protein
MGSSVPYAYGTAEHSAKQAAVQIVPDSRASEAPLTMCKDLPWQDNVVLQRTACVGSTLQKDA